MVRVNPPAPQAGIIPLGIATADRMPKKVNRKAEKDERIRIAIFFAQSICARQVSKNESVMQLMQAKAFYAGANLRK